MIYVRGTLPLFREDVDPRLWARLERGDEIKFEIIASPRKPNLICIGGNVEILDDDRAEWERATRE
jgi:hypothetical protein